LEASGTLMKLTRTAAAVVERAAQPFEGMRSPRPSLLVLGYHRIDDSGSHLSVRRDDFRAHLDLIARSGLGVVNADRLDLAAHAVTGVAFTFDDGYRSVAETAWPELRSRGWPATAYVASGYLEGDRVFPWDDGRDPTVRLMDKTDLCGLADDGMVIGSHTVNHRYLPGLRPDEARCEIVDSRSALEDLLGRSVTTFS